MDQTPRKSADQLAAQLDARMKARDDLFSSLCSICGSFGKPARGVKKHIERTQRQIKTLDDEILQLGAELRQARSEDFTDSFECPQCSNECVGHCYNMSFFVDDDGEIYYVEDPDNVYSVGDSEQTIPGVSKNRFSDLPTPWKKMIVRYLVLSRDTPRWFIHVLSEVEL